MTPDEVQAALEALTAGDGAKAIEVLKALIVSMAADESAETAPEAMSSPTSEAPATPPPEPGKMNPISAALRRMTGRDTEDEALEVVRATLANVATLEAERVALDLTRRRELVGELVKLGVEFPSTAWEGDPAKRIPVARLASEPIEGLRARVAQIRAARPRTPEPPVESEPDVASLSDAELAACKKRGIDPKDFVSRKASAARRVS